MTEKNVPKIMDFGLAKLRGGVTVTRESKTMGTVAYMSPEQARGETVNQRTDVWSFGVVFYEMLTGALPFQGDRDTSMLYAIVHEEPRSVRDINPRVPEELRAVVSRTLKKDRSARYWSGAEILADLKSIQRKFVAEELKELGIGRFFRLLRRPRIAIPASLGLLVLVLFSIWLFHRRSKIHWAVEQGLPEIKRLIEMSHPLEWGKRIEAFELAEKVKRYLPKDPSFRDLWAKCAYNVTVQTDPPGARVFIQEHTSLKDDWKFLGTTPLENIAMPGAIYRWRFEKEDYEPVAALAPTLRPDDSSLTVLEATTSSGPWTEGGACPQEWFMSPLRIPRSENWGISSSTNLR
jgi:hypothetical protein